MGKTKINYLLISKSPLRPGPISTTMASKFIILIAALCFLHTVAATCSSGYYSSGGYCYKCSSSCTECSQYSTNCVTCPPGQYELNFNCVYSCGSGYYKEEYDRECVYDGSDITDTITWISITAFVVLVVVIVIGVRIINKKGKRDAAEAAARRANQQNNANYQYNPQQPAYSNPYAQQQQQ